MAQRTEKEETEFKAVPETLTLCVNNCGFTGNPATNNMCQKCFNATTATAATSSSSSASASASVSASAGSIKFSERSPGSSLARSLSPERLADLAQPSTDRVVTASAALEVKSCETVATKREVNRCSGCRRKVGLTGFRCRCGDLFCWEHRYSDRHDCSYDYKAAGRDAIARENPVIKAAKIIRL